MLGSLDRPFHLYSETSKIYFNLLKHQLMPQKFMFGTVWMISECIRHKAIICICKSNYWWIVNLASEKIDLLCSFHLLLPYAVYFKGNPRSCLELKNNTSIFCTSVFTPFLFSSFWQKTYTGLQMACESCCYDTCFQTCNWIWILFRDKCTERNLLTPAKLHPDRFTQ